MVGKEDFFGVKVCGLDVDVVYFICVYWIDLDCDGDCLVECGSSVNLFVKEEVDCVCVMDGIFGLRDFFVGRVVLCFLIG